MGAQAFARRLLPVLGGRAGRGQQAIDFANRQHLGQWPAALGRFDRARGIVRPDPFGREKLEHLPNRREPPRHRGGVKAASRQDAQIVAQLIARRRCKRTAPAGQGGRKVGQIAPIGRKRVGRRAALGG